MKKCLLIFAITLIIKTSCFAGLNYQNFEPGNGSISYGWSWDSNVIVRFSGKNEPVHSGARSWKMRSAMYYGGMGIGSQVNPGNTDFDFSRNDRLVFWIYSLPKWGGNHNVGVKFFDRGNYANNGFQVWTTKTAFYGRWTELGVLFSQLPNNFNLRQVTKIEFTLYWPGTYYFDDIAAVRQDRKYQTFEPELRSGSTANEYGWKWNENDTVDFAQYPEPIKEGRHSWKLISTQKWGGTGIQSEEKRLLQTPNGPEQSFWYVDLHPEKNTGLVLWVYGFPENLMDNNLAVQFYDHGQHSSDDTKVVFWSNKAGRYGRWTRFTVPFNQLPSSLNLHDLDKVQLQEYWPGRYYFDDIRATGPILKIKESILPNGLVTWNKLQNAGQYTLQESRVGSDGPWVNVYSGTYNAYYVRWLAKTWYRVRWQEAKSVKNALPYISDWSQVVQYTPPSIFIKKERLKQGLVEWPYIPQADFYEVETAAQESGPWILIYSGPYRINWLRGTYGAWYRVRALKKKADEVISVTPWSKPQVYQPLKGFLRAKGLAIKDQDGNGKEILLQGVNLGSLLLIEKWMTGIGQIDTPAIEDEWTIRQVLTERFGDYGCQQLLRIYRDAYIKAIDFNNLLNLGINTIRLPIYYRILQDEQGRWVTDASGQIDFSPIDRLVNYCADRGIYVLLDLHGAPGGQSEQSHTGRQNFNKLFEDSDEGRIYRKRTVEIWKAIAEHYKDNPTVCGYDLLNEPIGAPSLVSLWQLYDRLYRAIRGIDKNHIIMMEGAWGWNTLPKPRFMRWENVVYQFHYYFWDNNENLPAHIDFINQKVAESRIKQKEYQVPVMIGEFNCFNLRSIWEYYLKSFNREKWSWTVWSYKCRYSPSEWGLYNHSDYNQILPKLRQDSFGVLAQKFSSYATSDFHSVNFTLSEIIRDYSVPPVSRPFIKSIEPQTLMVGRDFIIKGVNFGDSLNSGVVMLGGIALPVISWSDTSIRAYVPYSQHRSYGMVSVRVGNLTSNEVVLHIIQAPVVSSVIPPSGPRDKDNALVR